MGSLHVINEQKEYYINRVEAGLRLGKELQELKLKNPVVVAIPRGGLVPAWDISIALKTEMDFVICRKLRSPEDPEIAVGAVNEAGKLYLFDEALIHNAQPVYLEMEKEHQLKKINVDLARYRAILPKVSFNSRPVVLVDDGTATGFTMEAAIGAIKKEKPHSVILALPVGPKATIERLSEDADETVCLCAVNEFKSVSQYYLDYAPVSEKEVEEILRAETIKRSQSGGTGRKVS